MTTHTTERSDEHEELTKRWTDCDPTFGAASEEAISGLSALRLASAIWMLQPIGDPAPAVFSVRNH